MSTVDKSAGGQEFGESRGEPTTEKPSTGRTVRGWRPGRRARWGGAVAAVVLITGGVGAAAAHHGFEEDGRDHGHGGRRVARGDDDAGRVEHGDDDAGRVARGDDAAGRARVPAPLPSLDAADAVVKASSAVPGGKVESLGPVTEQGGGRAWRAVVLGPDGVRHAVVVDGAGSAITSNAVVGG